MYEMISPKLVVFTGGPCSGKSSVLEYLQKKGMNTTSETAREILIEKENDLNLQEEIFKRQVIKELELVKDLHFLDRSILDGIAYCKLQLGFIPDYFLEEIFKIRYDAVFLFDRIPLENDNIRKETEEEAEKIHQEIELTYKRLGYKIIAVPIFEGSLEESIEKRAEFILNHLKEKRILDGD